MNQEDSLDLENEFENVNNSGVKYTNQSDRSLEDMFKENKSNVILASDYESENQNALNNNFIIEDSKDEEKLREMLENDYDLKSVKNSTTSPDKGQIQTGTFGGQKFQEQPVLNFETKEIQSTAFCSCLTKGQKSNSAQEYCCVF